MYSAQEILNLVNEALAALPYDHKPESLYAPIRYALSLGGKRVRPVLMLMSYNLYRDDVKSIMGPALGLETYHNFTLLHDDVMDKAEVRRGKPCVHKAWNENAAILSGDTMLVQAYERMAQCDSAKLQQVMQLFTTTALEIGEGQQYDMEFETRDDVKEEEYIEMIRLKTSVLLACATKMGAMLADASEEDTEHLYQFGESLGLAFQLQDDYLDVYGDYKVFGKKIGGDILCNKKTYMLINAFLKATPEQRTELQKWIDAESFNPDEKIAAVTHIYNSIGVAQLAQEKIASYFQKAQTCLERVNLPSERKQELWKLALQLLNRQS